MTARFVSAALPPLPRSQGGVSLIELIVFIVIISVALAGVLSVFNLAGGKSADPLVRKQALAAAEAMLEEVLGKDFANPAGGFNPAVPGSPGLLAERPSFDDVADYNMTGAWNWNLRTLVNADSGFDRVELQLYSIQIAVGALVLNGVAGQQVTVTVTGPTGPVVLSGFRTNYE